MRGSELEAIELWALVALALRTIDEKNPVFTENLKPLIFKKLFIT